MFSLCFCIVCAWTHVFFNGFQHMLMQNLCCCYARHGIYVLVKSRNLAPEATSLKVSSFIKVFKRKSMLWEEAAKIDFNSFATSCCYVRPPARPAARPPGLPGLPDRPAAGLPARPPARPPGRPPGSSPVTNAPPTNGLPLTNERMHVFYWIYYPKFIKVIALDQILKNSKVQWLLLGRVRGPEKLALRAPSSTLT